MTYTPTKKELEELGFKDFGDKVFMLGGASNGYVRYDERLNIISTSPLYIYPQSIDDLKTLIRILTPQ